MKDLCDLGKNICIIGFSSNGKSTLAEFISIKLQIPVLHLDQIAHIPNTNWVLRDKQLLAKEHKLFIKQNSLWVIEGNYSFLMPERFSKASCIIWLDYNGLGSIYRYIKRCFFKTATRPGNLKGSGSEFSFKQLKHMLFTAPKNRPIYEKIIIESNVNYIRIKSMKELKQYYMFWNL